MEGHDASQPSEFHVCLLGPLTVAHQDMMQNSDAGDTALLRDRLVSSYNLPTDYRAMLYGGSVSSSSRHSQPRAC